MSLVAALTSGNAPSLVWLEPLAIVLLLVAGIGATRSTKVPAWVSLVAAVLQGAELGYGFIQLQLIDGYAMGAGFWLLVMACALGLAGGMLFFRRPTP